MGISHALRPSHSQSLIPTSSASGVNRSAPAASSEPSASSRLRLPLPRITGRSSSPRVRLCSFGTSSPGSCPRCGVANAEGRLAEIVGDFQKAEANLQRAVTRIGDCAAAYGGVSDKMRRQFNLSFFKQLLIDDYGMVSGELAEPFDLLLGEDLRRAAVAQASDELRDAVDEALRRRASHRLPAQNDRRPQERETLGGAAATSAISRRGGFSPNILVRMRGLEPPPGFPDTDLNRARLPIPPHPRASGGRRRYRTAPDSGTGPSTALPSGARVGACGNSPKHFASLVSSEGLPLSSRGLGRRPLMAETRVRIPVAVLAQRRYSGPSRPRGQ